MKKEIITVYFIKDDKGKIWREYINTDKRNLITGFVRHWFSILELIDGYDAQAVWRVFEKNGWTICERTLNEFND